MVVYRFFLVVYDLFEVKKYSYVDEITRSKHRLYLESLGYYCEEVNVD